MSPVRLIIPGDYWDSQLYRGRLYLTTMEGDTNIYNWDFAIDHLIRDRADRLTITCAFSRGDYLYHPEWSLVFEDPDVGTVLHSKFARLAQAPIELSATALSDCLLGTTEELGGLADDTAIYGNYLFAATQSGLTRTHVRQTRTKRNRAGVGPSARVWDGASLSLAVRRGGDLAIAAGDDGLFELNNLFNENLEDPRPVSPRHTLFVGYAHASIYGSSDRGGGYLAAYAWRKEQHESTLTRHFVRTFKDSDIFEHAHGMSWANQEKFYMCMDDKLLAVRYVQRAVGSEDSEPFQDLGSISVPTAERRILGGGVPFFGTVIEHDAGLVVVQSDGDLVEINGPVTRWRVFPRSSRYENHLHVIFEDRLEVYSFNHDYVVSQREKIAGIEYRTDVSWRPGDARRIARA